MGAPAVIEKAKANSVEPLPIERILCLDFETGGPNAEIHGPVQLGVSLMENGEPKEEKAWIFMPDLRRSYEPGAAAVHGTGLAMMQKAGRPCDEICYDLWNWAEELNARFLPIVAFNAAFDMNFFTNMMYLGDVLRPPLCGPWICSRMLALEAGFKPSTKYGRLTLDDAINEIGIERMSSSHDATEDAALAGRVYFEAQARIRKDNK